MASRALVAALLLAAAATAAGAPEPYRCEARGGPPWREYRSAHFVADTDLAPADARQLVAQLEQLHALELQALVGEVVEIPGRLRVVALRDPRQFRELAGQEVRAYYRHAHGGPAVVLQSEGLRVAPEAVAHELAHHLSRFLFPRQPAWFSEGLAQFVETAATPRRAEEAAVGSHIARAGAGAAGGRWVGLAPEAMAKAVRATPLVPAHSLLAWSGRIDHAVPTRFHLSSWLLYHYLWNKRSGELSGYQRRLSDGESPAAAWLAAFPGYDPARPETLAGLDAELERYRRGGRFTSYQVPLPEVQVPVSERALGSAEVHVLLAGVRAGWPAPRAEAEALLAAELDEALREDPTNPIAIVQRARLGAGGPPPLAALRASVAARPGDGWAWFTLASQLRAPQEAKEREACYREAVALEPDAASAQNSLAWLLVESGRAREALPFANRAVDLAPWDPVIIDTLAVVAGELGQCPQALQLARRAVEALPPEGERTSAVRRHLEDFQRRCGSPPASSAAPVPEHP
ncbi:tetratricopeptide repeat protein [Anaeromyxobacter diazotrophicus]|nr:tetratricopeptide repeat protein [Anaeromyxobacter diazotrophicus]